MTEQKDMTLPTLQLVPDFLYRFIRTQWLGHSHQWLVLRPGPPPEEFISLYAGEGELPGVRVCDAVGKVSKGFNLTSTGKAWELHLPSITRRINRKKNIVAFIPAGPPHYGMKYTTDIDREIQEANAILLAMSQDRVYDYDHCQTFIDRKAKALAKAETATKTLGQKTE